MIEKRKYDRVVLTGSAIISIETDSGTRSLQAIPSSMSMGGMGFYVSDRIGLYSRVSVHINFNSVDGPKSDTVRGSIVYEIPVDKMFFIGIEFHTKLNQEDQPLLYKNFEKVLSLGKKQGSF